MTLATSCGPAQASSRALHWDVVLGSFHTGDSGMEKLLWEGGEVRVSGGEIGVSKERDLR